ncbi:MAG: glycosyltransferase [Candidatus Saccharimonadales bacterium]
MKVAIVHDWLVGGGAEKVVLEISKLFPEAPIYTSYCSDEWQKRFDGKVVTSYMQHWPFSSLRKFLPVLRAHWFSHLDLSQYDLIISSSGNGEALGVKGRNGATHISYCHSPTHFYWRHYEQYLAQPGFGIFNPLARLGLRLLMGPMRRWDYKAAQRPDYFVANSTHIKNDIKKYYGRDSVVIHPPVEIGHFTASNKPRRGFVTVGRQVPLKRTDLIVQACTKLNLPLTVVGNGPEHSMLVELAGPSVNFVTDADIKAVARAMASAEAFLFASYEDFGITPVEAMATGTPVIAYKAGGALDYVVPGKTGKFFTKQTVESLVEVLSNFKGIGSPAAEISKAAERFSSQRFAEEFSTYIKSKLDKTEA